MSLERQQLWLERWSWLHYVEDCELGLDLTCVSSAYSAYKQKQLQACSLLCPLHISRSDAPIGLRCSRRQTGTKPSDVASGPHSHWPNGAQCVHSRRLVPWSRTILYDSLVGTVKESYLLQLSVVLYMFGSRPAGGVGQY